MPNNRTKQCQTTEQNNAKQPKRIDKNDISGYNMTQRNNEKIKFLSFSNEKVQMERVSVEGIDERV